MAVDVTVVIPTLHGGLRLRRLLSTLAEQTIPHQTLVVENGFRDGVTEAFPHVEVIRLDRNVGFGRAVNIGAARAEGRALVLLNDDCTCAPGFLEAISRALDPAQGVVMAAGVLQSIDLPGRIDTAGMELDATLLPFDYLNGAPLSVLDSELRDPIGPSAAAAAFDRDAYLEIGGFDEQLFAYWEDVDLVLRLRRAGATCVLARDARGTHAHSATLGSGSRMKNYLMGFGRGYVLRKWGVLRPRRLPQVVVRELAVCAGQAIVDRNVAGVQGRIRGYRAACSVERHPYPGDVIAGWRGSSAAGVLARRARRRLQLARARPSA
jgi:N-acetylglucosaminyl-diphospho-decaprenol L-rhamnosyltransferase